MDYKDRWQIIKHIEDGGQGKVYRALDTSKFEEEVKFLKRFSESINSLTSGMHNKSAIFPVFRECLKDIIAMENSSNHGALKILHEPKNAENKEKAYGRIKKEIEFMQEISHPNLLKILDADQDAQWFVSEFHENSTLAENGNCFTGNFVDALKAFRPLVEGVSEIHKNGNVHRDIKPQNIFLNNESNLVLGDFGLISYCDQQHTRISDTWENVGSRDWMPGWAMGMKIEDIRPTFDVYSLGKLLWAMVSNKPILNLWYFEEDRFNLEVMFPGAHCIRFANELFKKCIVEKEQDCISDAGLLLKEVDSVLTKIDINADIIGINIDRPCRVCGLGSYKLKIDRNGSGARNFGLDPHGSREFKIFICTYCGHVQLFAFDEENQAPVEFGQ